MGELRRYRKRSTALITAVRVDLETAGFTYEKWGGTQSCKPGDWLVDNDGETYTVDAETFARTYREVSPGRFVKVAVVWSETAESDGVISTREGETQYRAGDRLVYNEAGRGDGYAMSPERFDELYELQADDLTDPGSAVPATRPRTRDEHLFGPGPKRILALDGGGIRGILTVQVLRRMEELVRERLNDQKAVLSDYFDLIGGTSTGSIIAAGLALGWEVEQVDKLYRDLGHTIFDDSFLRRGLFRPKFPSAPLRVALRENLRDVELGDPDALKTGFALVAKRIDTGSPWVLHNNPRGKYFDRQVGMTSVPNSKYLLRDIVRASTAAPAYFEPEAIEVADGLEGLFVDGGVSPHNNPALQLLLLATLKGHGLEWPLGADKLLLVSVGTGSKEPSGVSTGLFGKAAAGQAVRALMSLMEDASDLNEQLLQWLSTSPTSRVIDSEVGDLSEDVLGGSDPWLTYLRYDARLDGGWLATELGLVLDEKDLSGVHAMDKPENMDTLATIGQGVAERLLSAGHLPTSFDPPSQM